VMNRDRYMNEIASVLNLADRRQQMV
jgi:hypothetical protein